jgi:hypothetical protein
MIIIIIIIIIFLSSVIQIFTSVQHSGGAIVPTKCDSITHEAHCTKFPLNLYNYFRIQFLTLIQVKNDLSKWVQFATVKK